MDKSQLMTIAAFAKAAGVSRQTVYKRLDKDLTGELTRYLTEVDSVKYIDKAALQFFVSTRTVKGDSQIDSQIDKEFDTDLTGFDSNLTAYLTMIDSLKEQIEALQQQLTVKDGQISFLQEQAARQLQTIDNLTAALTAAQTLHAMDKREQLQIIDQSREAPGERPEGAPATASTVEARKKQGSTEGATAPDPVKKKGLFAKLDPRNWKR